MAHLNEPYALVIEVDYIFCSLNKYIIGQGGWTRAEIIDAVSHERVPPKSSLFDKQVFIFL
jgi:hypothetical protein